MTQEEKDALKKNAFKEAKAEGKKKYGTPRPTSAEGQPVRHNTGDIKANTYASPEQISRIVGDKLKWMKEGSIRGPVKTEEQAERRITEYWTIVAETGEIPQKTDLYMFMGLARSTVDDWRNGRKCSRQMQHIIHQLDLMYNSVRDNMAAENLIQQIAYIWQSKQWQGYREPTTKYEVEQVTPLDRLPKIDEIEARYQDILVENTEE